MIANDPLRKFTKGRKVNQFQIVRSILGGFIILNPLNERSERYCGSFRKFKDAIEWAKSHDALYVPGFHFTESDWK